MNVYQKLQMARLSLQNTALKKSGHNKFAGYQYFELSDFLPAINLIFGEFGLCGVVSFGQDLATLRIINTEKPDEVIEITSPMADAQLKGCHPIQNLGAVETYSRRYLWVTAMEIVEHDALDASAPLDKPAPTQDKPISHKSVPSEAWDKMDVESQKYLQEVANETIAAAATSIDEAKNYLTNLTLDADEKAAVWSRLDSKLRSALKK